MSDMCIERGTRVPFLEEHQAVAAAMRVCRHIAGNLSKPAARALNRKDYGGFIESLSEYGITLKVVSDADWLRATHNLTSGHFDPETLTISLPETIYVNAHRGCRDALSVFFHELGHVSLAHKALLHSSIKQMCMEEDSEWQADWFSNGSLEYFGFESKQMSFPFMLLHDTKGQKVERQMSKKNRKKDTSEAVPAGIS